MKRTKPTPEETVNNPKPVNNSIVNRHDRILARAWKKILGKHTKEVNEQFLRNHPDSNQHTYSI